MPVHRAPWPSDFPRVVLHTTVKTRDAHPDYAAAKAGDAEAAYRLGSALILPDKIAALKAMAGKSSFWWIPVHAEESLYQPSLMLTDGGPIAERDRHDAPGLGGEFVPSLTG